MARKESRYERNFFEHLTVGFSIVAASVATVVIFRELYKEFTSTPYSKRIGKNYYHWLNETTVRESRKVREISTRLLDQVFPSNHPPTP